MQNGLMRDTAFVRLWISNTASGLATWALPFVLGLVIVGGELGAAQVGMALAARTTGFILAMPLGGVLADRSGPRRMILCAGLSAAFGIIPIILGIAASWGLVAIVLGAGIAGFGQGACRASYQAIIPRVVPGENRQAANAAMTISIRVSILVGPVLATAAALRFGAVSTLWLIAVLWSVAALVPSWPERAATKTGHARLTGAQFLSELSDGLTEARRHPWFVAGLGALTVVIAFGYSVTSILLPQVSQAQYGGPRLLAASVTAYTLGALAGALLVARWKSANIGWIALAGLALYGLVPLSLLQADHFALPVIAFFMAGTGVELFNVPWFTATQREIPADRLARVSSIDFLFSYGLAPLGLAGLAPLVEMVGLRPVLGLCGAICVAAPLAAMSVRGSRGFSMKSGQVRARSRTSTPASQER
ncbi:MFS transporter [Mameliella sp.]|uniref:MFS transporter n=1 Tax=Mameliella sp. TaxID=1924940 RepID=UPI003BADBC94